MNQRCDEKYIVKFLDLVKVIEVQDLGLTPFGEFLPRSSPIVDYLPIGLHSGAGWKYLSAQTIHGIQVNRDLSYQMLENLFQRST